MASLREYVSARELLINLTLRELRSRYKSVLGWAWSLLNPLTKIAIYSLVFGGLPEVGRRPEIRADSTATRSSSSAA